MDTNTDQTNTFSQGAGYLIFIGYLQLVAGAMSVLFSSVAIVLALLVSDSSWLNPISAASSFGPPESGFLIKLIGAYAAFELAFGWIFGLLMIVSGGLCLKRRRRRLVTTSAIINLFNFPHGTTVAILVLHGITRPRISGAFRDR